MDRESAKPEELPPLELTKLRDLDVERDEGDERPGYIFSASAVVRRADYAYVVGDDELDLAVFALSDPGRASCARRSRGELPTTDDERAREKPDLEALTALPPFEGAPFGGLLGLGSGSSDRSRPRLLLAARRRTARSRASRCQIDLAPLYDLLRAELGELNVEGAAVLRRPLLVFHRGNAEDAPERGRRARRSSG